MKDQDTWSIRTVISQLQCAAEDVIQRMNVMNAMEQERNLKSIGIAKMIKWWTRKSLHDDKGGSFNLNLYLQVCQAKEKEESPVGR